MTWARHMGKSDKGSALVTGLIVMLMVALLGCAYVTLSMNNLLRVGRDERRATAFYLAEAGLEYVIAQILAQAESTGVISAQTFDTTAQLGDLCSGATGQVVVLPDTGANTLATVTSSATHRGITETVRVRLKIKSVGVWNNAIFAGIGQSGRGINGNVDIRGSVHILGEGDPYSDFNTNGQRDEAEAYIDSNGNGKYDSGEPFTDTDGSGIWSDSEPYQDNNLNGMYDPPLTATELATDISGTAYVGNNYSGIPADLEAKIPALIPEEFSGEWVKTLEAELRVKHGKVNISGSATVGSPNVAGNSVKETLDGVYVSDGWGGNKGSSGVYADNGTTQVYDLGDRVPFPGLMDPYTDPATGISYGTHEAYLDSNSLTITESDIKSGVASFSHSDAAGNSIDWNDTSKTLTIQGIVRINGDLDLSAKGTTIYFADSGTLFSKGTVKVHGSVMPKTMFPTADAMGCIAKYDIEFATGGGEAQLKAAGAWYAQRTIKSAKQNQFAGTYVANYFELGTNVPNIYQVPALAQNLPPGMPGGDNITAVYILSWVHVRPGV
ncbi:MAG TPA: pilus assembly PilX N-terminal domain-containing protein [Armatimonadota bacterium]|nr:pilus assembly PilX N-terminal domain-containing protein [Armatimonadota bacterium]